MVGFCGMANRRTSHPRSLAHVSEGSASPVSCLDNSMLDVPGATADSAS